MKLSDKTILRRLGNREAIDTICGDAEISRDEFDLWWRRTIKSRLPSVNGEATVDVGSSVQIQRDRWGIPHILAENDVDLFFGFGYAMAQDRLFQLDYLRRKGLGRLSEILGEDGLEMDTIARTVGLNRIAESEWEQLPDDVRQTLESFSRGVNALIESSADQLPIEFDLLDYQPEPWTPIDCLAIENEFRWYLTGRFPVIVIPELAKRTLGTGPLYEEFLLGEAGEESILQPGDYSPRPQEANATLDPVGHVMGDPDAATGSNNWVVAGSRTTTGAPLLASDPHIAFEAVSCWYEAHLCGGSFNVAGMAYVGIPAIMFGRSEKVAWGITNNICSQRDLYKEQTDSDYPGCFQYDGQWEREREVIEEIKVRGREPIKKCVRFSRNGPVVNEILPKEFPAAHDNETITLKWIGAYGGGWLTSLLAMDRANNVNEFREALRPWHVPTFSMVIADVDGQVAFQSVGRIPIRKSIERGMRPGWEPDHQWQGLIPFESMPHMVDPSRGWIASANNRLAPDDYPYKLFGCWNSGWRAARIRQMIESHERLAIEDMREMHQDTMSLRAASLTLALLVNLSSREDARIRQSISILQSWDFQIQSDSVAATIFNTFFALWCQEVAAERFEGDQAELMAAAAAGLAGRLLTEDRVGWFADGRRGARIEKVFTQTLDHLTERLGSDISNWKWERFHRRQLKHVLSSRGDLASLLDQAETGVNGDMVTVCNTGSGPEWKATTGAGYRLVADLASSPPVLMAIDGQSQSGNPGSSHYHDQFDEWLNGGYHNIPLDRNEASASAVECLTLVPFHAAKQLKD